MSHNKKNLSELQAEFFSGLGVPKPEPFVPDSFQQQSIQAVLDGKDSLVIAPTGAGKTYIAVEAIRHTMQQGKRAVYTAPLKALSNSKYAEFKQKFEPEFRVGLLTGDRKIEGDADVVVATTEIYRNELYSYQENYSLVVLDEFHYLADPQRGAVWEESIILSPSSAVLLMLSASISNPEQIASWIRDVRRTEVEIITVKKRPVELRFGFLHPDLGVIPLEDEAGEVREEVTQFYGAGRHIQDRFGVGGGKGRGGKGNYRPRGGSGGNRGGRRRS